VLDREGEYRKKKGGGGLRVQWGGRDTVFCEKNGKGEKGKRHKESKSLRKKKEKNGGGVNHSLLEGKNPQTRLLWSEKGGGPCHFGKGEKERGICHRERDSAAYLCAEKRGGGGRGDGLAIRRKKKNKGLGEGKIPRVARPVNPEKKGEKRKKEESSATKEKEG